LKGHLKKRKKSRFFEFSKKRKKRFLELWLSLKTIARPNRDPSHVKTDDKNFFIQDAF